DGRGLSMAVMADIANFIDNYVIGFVLSEARLEGMKRQRCMTDEEWNAAIAPHLQRLIATGRYPIIARLMKEVSTTEPDQSFDLGLDCLFGWDCRQNRVEYLNIDAYSGRFGGGSRVPTPRGYPVPSHPHPPKSVWRATRFLSSTT